MDVSKVSVGTSGLNGSALNTSARFSNSMIQGRQQNAQNGAQQSETSSQHSGTDGQSKGVIAGSAAQSGTSTSAIVRAPSQKTGTTANPEGGKWRKFYMSGSPVNLDDKFTAFRVSALFASVTGKAGGASMFRPSFPS